MKYSNRGIPSFLKILLFMLCLFVMLGIFYIDIKFLPNEITLLLPYVLLVSVVTFYVGNKTGFIFAWIAIFFWIASSSNFLKNLSYILYFNAIIKSIFIFLQYILIVFLKKKYQEVESLSFVDELTGLRNRRGFNIFADYELNSIKRRKESISLLFIDIDNFKKINDTMGHGEGDKVLKEVGNVFRNILRKGDIAARFGGDEFCILLSNVDKNGTQIISERIIRRFHDSCIEAKWPTTLSIGILNTDKESNLEDLIKKGDELMYRAKMNGKNGIEYEEI